MLRIKKKYQSVVMSNGNIRQFNTNDITQKTAKYYASNGFEFIFDEVCDKCESIKCKCKK